MDARVRLPLDEALAHVEEGDEGVEVSPDLLGSRARTERRLAPGLRNAETLPDGVEHLVCGDTSLLASRGVDLPCYSSQERTELLQGLGRAPPAGGAAGSEQPLERRRGRGVRVGQEPQAGNSGDGFDEQLIRRPVPPAAISSRRSARRTRRS